MEMFSSTSCLRHWVGSPPGGHLLLGLSIVHHIVELHGGEITASSAGLGLGSRFVVKFPLPLEI